MKDFLTEKYEQVLENVQEPKMRIAVNGDRQWILNGRLHRLEGPAVITLGGTKRWYVNNEPHRLDGPAIEWFDGDEDWFRNGKRHRLDGPAVVRRKDNYNEWWINGVNLSKDEFNRHLERIKEIEKGSEEAGANLDF